MCVFVHCKHLYVLCLKKVDVLFRAVCFFEKKIVLFLLLFLNLGNDINFLVIEFKGCMNGKLQVWCKCTAPYIWLSRA